MFVSPYVDNIQEKPVYRNLAFFKLASIGLNINGVYCDQILNQVFGVVVIY